MRKLSLIRSCISIILKLIVIISSAAGIAINVLADRNTLRGAKPVFMYFTTQSNILIALICAWGAYLILSGSRAGEPWYIVKLAGTVSITLTGVVYVTILAPIPGGNAWSLQSILLHVLVPVVAVADFYVAASGNRMPRKDLVYVIVPPLLYAIYSGIGYALGWEFSSGRNYPYFFLNWGSSIGVFGFDRRLPYMGTGWWILLIFAFLILVGYCYMVTTEKLGRSSGREKDI